MDGAGLCSPGRWSIDQRLLPDDYTSRRLRKALEEGLDRAMKEMRTRRKDEAFDMKRLLMELAIGRDETSPFDEALVEEIRTDLRIICKQAGYGPGLPEEGDAVQLFQVKLIQALLGAFSDPDAYMCSWWAKGAWLGSPTRKLPQAPQRYSTGS